MKVCSVCRRCYDAIDVSCVEQVHPPLSETHPGSSREMVNGYCLDVLLESGLKGDVYQAHQIATGAQCIIRIITTGEKERERVVREAKAAGAMFHPNLADVYDAGSLDNGLVFIVSEQPAGQTLRQLLSRGRVPELLTSIQILTQTAEALHALHQNGLTHNAVRPESVVLTTDADCRLLVRVQDIDHGGVGFRAIISNKFLIDSALDSIRYFSPEQCTGESAGPQTDIYSLGVVFYEMLAGAPPFDATSATALIHKQRNERPPDVRIQNFHLRMLLTHTLMESLQKQPGFRNASANAFARQMRHIEQLATHVSTPPPAGAVPEALPRPAPAFVPTPQPVVNQAPVVASSQLVAPSLKTVPPPVIDPTPVVATPLSVTTSHKPEPAQKPLLEADGLPAVELSPTKPTLSVEPKAVRVSPPNAETTPVTNGHPVEKRAPVVSLESKQESVSLSDLECVMPSEYQQEEKAGAKVDSKPITVMIPEQVCEPPVTLEFAHEETVQISLPVPSAVELARDVHSRQPRRSRLKTWKKKLHAMTAAVGQAQQPEKRVLTPEIPEVGTVVETPVEITPAVEPVEARRVAPRVDSVTASELYKAPNSEPVSDKQVETVLAASPALVEKQVEMVMAANPVPVEQVKREMAASPASLEKQVETVMAANPVQVEQVETVMPANAAPAEKVEELLVADPVQIDKQVETVMAANPVRVEQVEDVMVADPVQVDKQVETVMVAKPVQVDKQVEAVKEPKPVMAAMLPVQRSAAAVNQRVMSAAIEAPASRKPIEKSNEPVAPLLRAAAASASKGNEETVASKAPRKPSKAATGPLKSPGASITTKLEPPQSMVESVKQAAKPVQEPIKVDAQAKVVAPPTLPLERPAPVQRQEVTPPAVETTNILFVEQPRVTVEERVFRATPKKIEWVQPDDDIPSEADVLNVLVNDGVIDESEKIGPHVFHVAEPKSADDVRAMTATERRPVETPPAHVLPMSADEVRPATASAPKTVPPPVQAEPKKRVEAESVIRRRPPVQANPQRVVATKPAPKPAPAVNADDEEITLVRPPKQIRINVDQAVPGGAFGAAWNSSRATDDAGFFPTLIGERARHIQPESREAMFSTYYSAPVRRTAIPYRTVMFGGGVLVLVVTFLIGDGFVGDHVQSKNESMVSKSKSSDSAPRAKKVVPPIALKSTEKEPEAVVNENDLKPIPDNDRLTRTTETPAAVDKTAAAVKKDTPKTSSRDDASSRPAPKPTSTEKKTPVRKAEPVTKPAETKTKTQLPAPPKNASTSSRPRIVKIPK